MAFPPWAVEASLPTAAEEWLPPLDGGFQGRSSESMGMPEPAHDPTSSTGAVSGRLLDDDDDRVGDAYRAPYSVGSLILGEPWAKGAW